MGWSMDWVHGPGPWGGPWTRSIGWSMDPGPCFVYVLYNVVSYVICSRLVVTGVLLANEGKRVYKNGFYLSS